MHKFQNAVDRIFQRRVRFAPHGGVPRHLIGRVVIPFELHRRDVVDRAHQKIQQRKEKIFLPASPDQLGNKIGKAEYFELPASRFGNEPGNIHHVRIIVPNDMVGLIRSTRSGRDGNDIVRHNVGRNKADLVESIDANAVIHHKGNQANGDIEVVASAR